MKTGVIYARYSSKKQTEQSIEGQIHACMQYAEQNNIKIVDTYIDRAVSGKTDNRENFQKMIYESQNKKYDFVLVYKLDRFARNRYDSAIHKATLKRNGKKVLSAMENLQDNPESVLLESLLEGLAEYYSLNLAQNINRGRKESILKGQYLGGYIPYGYSIKNKKYIVIPQEANVITIIFNLCCNGFSQKQIINYLTENKIFNRQDKPFSYHQINTILNNETYIGNLTNGNVRAENVITPIIKKEVFKMAKQKLQDSFKSRPNTIQNFLLSGKLFCGECGSIINGDSCKKKNKTYLYYSCKNNRKNKICDMKSIPKEKLEETIFNIVVEHVNNHELDNIAQKVVALAQADNNYNIEIKNIMQELSTIHTKLSNIANAVKQGIINNEIKKENENLLKLKTQKENDLYLLQKMPILNLTENKVKSTLKKYIAENNPDYKNLIFKYLIYKVYVFKNKVIVILNLTNPNNKKEKQQIESKIDASVRANFPEGYHERRNC